MPSRLVLILFFATLLTSQAGCGVVHFLAGLKEGGDKRAGIVFYVGGAGPGGHVGSYDVPDGLRDAGYRGFIEIFAWQGWTHVGDQLNLDRNRGKANDLMKKIRRYRDQHPRGEIHIIALSAGTGIATFALEYLPESIRVDNVVFLGCSMSSHYDLTRALRRIDGGLYVLHSPYDEILKRLVRYIGTVDRQSAAEGVAGLRGFRRPSPASRETEALYQKVYNIPYRAEFAAMEYEGGHLDSTARRFVATFLAPVVMGDASRLVGRTSGGVPPAPDVPRLPVQRDEPAATDRPTTEPDVRPARESGRPPLARSPVLSSEPRKER